SRAGGPGFAGRRIAGRRITGRRSWPAPRVGAKRPGPDPRTGPGGITVLRPALVPAVGLRPAGGVLRRHGVYPGALIAASALDGLPTTIFPVLRSMKPRWGFGRMPSCSASCAITAGFAA